jgi:prepilin-type N-terminal cleavage/methylation domain-containing protein
MHGRRTSSQHSRAGEADGFTLIELLVVITILGILAAIVVFSVKGIGDKGADASAKTDATVLSTAEEAYCAQNGSYATLAQLRTPPGFLATDPKYNGVVKTPTGNCGGTGFIVGSTSYAPTTGALILGASNTTPPFSFIGASFAQSNGAVKFKFNSSSALKTDANAHTGNPVLFASADKANIDGVTTGVASTKQQYTTGRLVAFSCKSGGQTLAPAAGAPTCKAPAGGYQGALTGPDLGNLVSRLLADPSLKLSIADPGAKVTITGSTGSWTCTVTGAAATAPYGLAAYEALTAATSSGGGGMSCNDYGDLKAANRIIYGTNVTATQTNVVSGAAHFALIPKSFVKSPNGDDTDSWFTVDSSAHTAIAQWAIVIDDDGNGVVSAGAETLGKQFLDYVLSPAGKAVMAEFGYDPVP